MRSKTDFSRCRFALSQRTQCKNNIINLGPNSRNTFLKARDNKKCGSYNNNTSNNTKKYIKKTE